MLKRRSTGSSELPLLPFVSVEVGLSAILTQVFDEPVNVQYSAIPEAFTPTLPWIVARKADGGEVGIALGSSMEPVEYFSQLVRLAACHADRGVPLAFKQAWEGVPAKQHHFTASPVGVTREQPIGLFVAATEETLLASTWGQESKEASQLAHVACRAELALAVDTLEGGHSIVRKADGVVRISVLQKQFGVRLYGRQDRIEAFIGLEETMTQKTMDTGCCFTLSLGEIELSLEDALRLREGMVIEFERPQAFEAQLLLNGVPWAATQVELEERSVRLTVRELEWNQSRAHKKKETTAPDSRLSSEALSI
jgi:flagellar motor switch/type III secretory pathway protein FliN